MGAEATCFDDEGFTPFHKAVLNGNTTLIELLVEEGADVNAKSLNNTTPLQLAFKSNHILISYLLFLNAYLTVERISIAQLLITKYGADLNCIDKLGRTPLHWAAFSGDMESVTFLLDAGASIPFFFLLLLCWSIIIIYFD